MLSKKRKEEMIFETKRLVLRKMKESDYSDLCKMLQDEEVMRAYEHAFSHEEVVEWLDNQLRRYEEDGFGLWAVILKKHHKMIGQCGLTLQWWDEKMVMEIGYLFNKAYWHQGYAIEAAKGVKNYAFEVLNAEAVYSIIRENNLPSRRVAKRNGMNLRGRYMKHYYKLDMPHLVYGVDKEKQKT